MIKIVIPLNPITKNNAHYKQYRNIINKHLKEYFKEHGTIYGILEIKTLFYRKTNRKVDLTNLQNTIHDLLVHNKIILDDNMETIRSTDGSRILFDYENPRTEILINTLKERKIFDITINNKYLDSVIAIDENQARAKIFENLNRYKTLSNKLNTLVINDLEVKEYYEN